MGSVMIVDQVAARPRLAPFDKRLVPQHGAHAPEPHAVLEQPSAQPRWRADRAELCRRQHRVVAAPMPLVLLPPAASVETTAMARATLLPYPR
eukprot:SAG22_NODE_1751_length_3659_cov_67.046067_2_plen_93_part_00